MTKRFQNMADLRACIKDDAFRYRVGVQAGIISMNGSTGYVNRKVLKK